MLARWLRMHWRREIPATNELRPNNNSLDNNLMKKKNCGKNTNICQQHPIVIHACWKGFDFRRSDVLVWTGEWIYYCQLWWILMHRYIQYYDRAITQWLNSHNSLIIRIVIIYVILVRAVPNMEIACIAHDCCQAVAQVLFSHSHPFIKLQKQHAGFYGSTFDLAFVWARKLLAMINR